MELTRSLIISSFSLLFLALKSNGTVQSSAFWKTSLSSLAWNSMYYKTVGGPKSAVECGSHCLADANCQVFVRDPNSKECKLAASSLQAFMDAPLGQVSGYISSNILSNPALSYFYEAPEVQSDTWTQHITATIGDVSSLVECAMNCLIFVRNCDFFVLDQDQCILGNFSYTNGSADLKTSAPWTLYPKQGLNISLWTTREIQGYEHRLGTYKTIATASLDACALACYFDTPSGQCQFYLVHDSTCYLGNPQNDTPLDQPVAGVLTSYIMVEHTRDSGLHTSWVNYPIILHSLIWQPMMNSVLDNVLTIDECATISYMTMLTNVFAFKDGKCYLGAHWHQSGPGGQVGPSVDTIYWRSKEQQTGYTPVPLASSAWAPKVYKNVTISTNQTNECLTNCFADGEVCDAAILIGFTCYLASLITQSNFVTSTDTAIAHVRLRIAAVLLGGRDAGSTKIFSSSLAITGTDQTCSVDPIPFPDSFDTFSSAMVFVDGHIILTGGISLASGLATDTTLRMDMGSLGHRSWSLGARMTLPRAYHSLIIPSGTVGRVWAVGGFEDDGTCTSDFDEYDVANDGWRKFSARMPGIGRQRHCTIEWESKIYLIGGRSCTNPYSMRQDGINVLDRPSNRWSVGPAMKMAREFLGCQLFFDSGVAKVVAFGGLGLDGQAVAQPEELDLSTPGSSWTLLTAMAKSIAYLSSANLAMTVETRNYIFAPFTQEDGYGQYFFDFLDSDGSDRISEQKYLPSSIEIGAEAAQASIPLNLLAPKCYPLAKDWVLMMRQKVPEVFGPSQWSVNAADANSSLYSVLDTLESWRSCNNRFHFRLVWSDLTFFNEWWQETNPTSQTVVQGYSALAVYYQSGFAGLMMTDDSDSLMSGFVGAKTLTANSKLRGPVLNSVELEVDEISLYVKQDC